MCLTTVINHCGNMVLQQNYILGKYMRSCTNFAVLVRNSFENFQSSLRSQLNFPFLSIFVYVLFPFCFNFNTSNTFVRWLITSTSTNFSLLFNCLIIIRISYFFGSLAHIF
uniref:Uncharacterized protein n=1 Tax=Meloidogyne incognita TaxID=6306 RepID=A0A914L7M9_MELIC